VVLLDHCNFKPRDQKGCIRHRYSGRRSGVWLLHPSRGAENHEYEELLQVSKLPIFTIEPLLSYRTYNISTLSLEQSSITEMIHCRKARWSGRLWKSAGCSATRLRNNNYPSALFCQNVTRAKWLLRRSRHQYWKYQVASRKSNCGSRTTTRVDSDPMIPCFEVFAKDMNTKILHSLGRNWVKLYRGMATIVELMTRLPAKMKEPRKPL